MIFAALFQPRSKPDPPSDPPQSLESSSYEVLSVETLYPVTPTRTSHRASRYGPIMTSAFPSLASPPAVEKKRPTIQIVDSDHNKKESPVEVDQTPSYRGTPSPPSSEEHIIEGNDMLLLDLPLSDNLMAIDTTAKVLEPARPESTTLPTLVPIAAQEQLEDPTATSLQDLTKPKTPLDSAEPVLTEENECEFITPSTPKVDQQIVAKRPIIPRGPSYVSTISTYSTPDMCIPASLYNVQPTDIDGGKKSRNMFSHLRRTSSDMLSSPKSLKGHQRRPDTSMGFTLSQSCLGTYIQSPDEPEIDLYRLSSPSPSSRIHHPILEYTSKPAIRRIDTLTRRRARPSTAPNTEIKALSRHIRTSSPVGASEYLDGEEGKVFSMHRNPSLVNLIKGVVSPRSTSSPVIYKPGYEPVSHTRESFPNASVTVNQASEPGDDDIEPRVAAMESIEDKRHSRDMEDWKTPLGRFKIRARKFGRSLTFLERRNPV